MYCIAAANSFAIWSLRASAKDFLASGSFGRGWGDASASPERYSAQRKPVSDCAGSIGLVGIPAGTAGSL